MLDLSSIKPFLDMAVQHKAAAVGAFLLSSGVGAQIVVRLLILIPLDGWYSALRATAATVSAAGSTRFTKPLWTPVESWFEAFLGKSVDAIREGLDSDDDALKRDEACAVAPPLSVPERAVGPGPVPAGPAVPVEPLPPYAPGKCGLCGEAMPPGEEMFNYHGSSGPCPTPPVTPAGAPGPV